MRNSVCSELKQNPEVVALVNRMEVAQCIYLLSVCRMEKMRVVYSTRIDSVHYFFRYLEDRAIRKDKSGMWLCLLSAVSIIFDEYLKETRKLYADDGEIEPRLEYHAQFLLVQFNNNLKEVHIQNFEEPLLSMVMFVCACIYVDYSCPCFYMPVLMLK